MKTAFYRSNIKEGNQKMNEIRGFRGAYAFLSNFHPCAALYEGIKYPCAETAFQAAKCADIQERRQFELLLPREAKKFGRRIKLRADWESVKVEAMREILRAKFTNNPELRDKLQGSRQTELIEENNWHDNFWGDCVCERCKSVNGQNMLGKLLMEIRGEIKSTMKNIRKFVVGRKYFSDDGCEIYVCNRFGDCGLRAEVGFGFPANYKIHTDAKGCEYINAKGHIFRAFP